MLDPKRMALLGGMAGWREYVFRSYSPKLKPGLVIPFILDRVAPDEELSALSPAPCLPTCHPSLRDDSELIKPAPIKHLPL